MGPAAGGLWAVVGAKGRVALWVLGGRSWSKVMSLVGLPLVLLQVFGVGVV